MTFYQLSAYFQTHLAYLQEASTSNYEKKSQFFTDVDKDLMLRVFFTKLFIWKEKSEITLFRALRRILNEFKQIVWDDFYDNDKVLMDEEESFIFADSFQHSRGFNGWDIDNDSKAIPKKNNQRLDESINNQSTILKGLCEKDFKCVCGNLLS